MLKPTDLKAKTELRIQRNEPRILGRCERTRGADEAVYWTLFGSSNSDEHQPNWPIQLIIGACTIGERNINHVNQENIMVSVIYGDGDESDVLNVDIRYISI